MDYSAVGAIMSAKGITSEPAWRDLNVLVAPTPNMDGCPLGLYFPDFKLVQVPPDASEAVLLHELGHRYGDFHYQDLSERFAEQYRKRYQAGSVQLYMGNDFNRLPKFGQIFEEGERGAIEIAFRQPPTMAQLLALKQPFYGHGEALPRFYYGGDAHPTVRIEFTKEVDWMVVLGASLAGTVVATVGVIGYAVYKISKELPWVIPVSLFGTGLFFLLRAAARQARASAPARA